MSLVKYWPYLAGGGAVLLFFLYVTDRIRKMYRRRCKKCSCLRQARMCSMVELELGPGDTFGDGHRRFLVHIFRICTKCNAVAHRSTERHLSRFQLWWKHRTEPQVFQSYPELLARAGGERPSYPGREKRQTPSVFSAVEKASTRWRSTIRCSDSAPQAK